MNKRGQKDGKSAHEDVQCISHQRNTNETPRLSLKPNIMATTKNSGNPNAGEDTEKIGHSYIGGNLKQYR